MCRSHMTVEVVLTTVDMARGCLSTPLDSALVAFPLIVDACVSCQVLVCCECLVTACEEA